MSHLSSLLAERISLGSTMLRGVAQGEPSRGRGRRIAVGCGLVAFVGLGVLTVVIFATPTRIATVESGGRAHSIAIPGPALEVHSGPPRVAVFAVLGDRDLHEHLVQHAGAHGWQYGEQLGSLHTLHKPGFVMTVGRRQWGASFIVLLEVEVLPVASPAHGA